ncbi:MAG: PilN domain-containing protein [Moraxella sp.]|nr:PilN domain-containing protein [Moraxella sp.]
MARINLLPWRQEERERKNKEFGVLLAGAAVLAILAAVLIHTLFNYALSNQQRANETVTEQNKQLDGVLTEIADLEQQKEEMLSRMEVIQNLQGLRSVPVRIWDDIAKAIPSSVYLTGVKREGDTITLTGYADNTRVVSDLIRNLDATPWLSDSFMPNARDANVQAYQDQTAQNRNLGTQGSQRPLYPEDSYIQFSVVTKVSAEAAKEELDAQSQAASAESAAAQNPTAETAEAGNAPNPNGAEPAPIQPAQENSPAEPAKADEATPSEQPTSAAPNTDTAPAGGQS